MALDISKYQPMQLNNKALDYAKLVKLLILDVDGVLTDGGLYFDDNGTELKRFNALDGHGIKMLRNSGVEVAIISARKAECVAHRMKSLGVEHYYQGQSNKVMAYTQLLDKLNLKPTQVAFVGDDVIDLPVMSKVSLPIAVANAHDFVKNTLSQQLTSMVVMERLGKCVTHYCIPTGTMTN